MILQEQSNERPYTGRPQSHIESVGRTLLNIAKRLGIWHFKREIEDLVEQLRSPRKFAEIKQEHARILEQDAGLLADTCQLLTAAYQEATKHPIQVVCTPCGIAGLKRRLQDAHTTITSQKTQLNGFDLVTFDVIVPTVNDCYEAFGVLSQLGHIQDRVTDQVANPKPNGYSHVAFGLIMKPQGLYTQDLKWPTTYTRICQLQVSTPLMQAITWYGCLHPGYYQLFTRASLKEKMEPPSIEQLWSSKEGKVFLTIQEDLTTGRTQPKIETPIVVYDKNRHSIALPKGATALDFAYALDREIGDHAVEAFINNRKAPLYRVLDAGDIVEIRTRPADEGQVNDSWLDNAITPEAQKQIKESLSRRNPEREGYTLLRQVLERYHFMLTPENIDHELRLLLKRHSLGTPQTYLKQLDKTGEPPYTPEWAAQEIMQQIAERHEPLTLGKSRHSWAPVLDMQLTANKRFFHQQLFCNSCQPTYPRDVKIMGRLRKRRGELIVHKENCPHLMNHTVGHPPVLLPMTWQPQPPAFRVAFFLVAQDRTGLILDITRQLRRHQCELVALNAEAALKFGLAHMRFTIETHADKEVLDIWEEISKIENVTKVDIDAAVTPPSTRKRLEELRLHRATLSEATTSEPAWEEAFVPQQPRNQLIDNPFDISRPATAKMFFGRSEETERMQRELCEGDYGKAIILYGPRRSGKTSICKNFLERHVQSPFWNVLFSLQNATRKTEETILMELAEKVCEEFNEQLQCPAPGWQQYNDCDPQIRFRRILQDCIAQAPDTRLVLALDEFGGALDSYEKHILDYRFFTYWKDLMNDIPQLSLILALPTSSHNTLTSKEFVNAFSFADELPISFLDTESAKQLLVNPLQERNIGIFSSTIALAIKLTGRNPYYLTLLGKQLINLLYQEPYKERITDADLHLVVDQLIEGGYNQNFDFLGRELQNNDELHILETIVDLTSHQNQAKAYLKKIATRLNLPGFVVRRHLDRLRNGLTLQEHGPSTNPYYTFTIELVHRWLTRNRWFFSTATQK